MTKKIQEQAKVCQRVKEYARSTRERGLYLRLSVVIILAALLLPTIYFGSPTLVSAKTHSPIAASVPVSAPPEPFLLYAGATGLGSVVTLASSLSTRLSTLFAASAVLPEFALAKPPSLAERLSSNVLTLLAFVVPNYRSKTSSKTVSHLASPPAPTAGGTVKFDFNGDGKADIGRWHSSNYQMKVAYSGSTSTDTYPLGSSASAKAAPGDFNGDGKTDAAVFNAGTWTYMTSPTATAQTISLGASGDIPMAGDYDGDGTTDAAVFTPLTNVWSIKKSSDGTVQTYNFGQAGDIPITGDFDGDGKTDIGVYRPTTSAPCYWYIRLSSTGATLSIPWGSPSDIPVQGDFDGDGKSDPAVYRPSTGTWYVAESSFNYTKSIQQGWGSYGDQPTPADYDGDGITDFSVWRPTSGVWYTIRSSDSTYTYQTLGVPGDTAVPSAYTKQVGGGVSGYDMGTARTASRNATGSTNLYSQNFSWGTSLVNLPGRSGLNAGFGISYNSLIWINNNSTMYFDPDTSNISPGFRFGFPTIEPVYYDSVKAEWVYMMVAPNGGRVEFRQVAASNGYVTGDSGYSQLVTTGASSPNAPVENITIKVTTTDGTQMSYVWAAGAFRCTQILDRNGNYITITNDGQGLLTKVTDTLGRDINVNYDTTLCPTSITQSWKGTNGSGSTTTHTWATFSYTTQTVNTNFGTLAVAGPPNGTVIKTLDKVTYADGSFTKFLYNGYIQVQQIENYAPDNHKLNHVRTSLDSISGAQSDCPRFTETSNYAENFNGGVPVTVYNTAPASDTFYGPVTESAKMVKVSLASSPDNHYSKMYFGLSATGSVWKEGLPIATEDCIGTDSACATRKRWTWTKWEQDEYNQIPFNYVCNPRVIETQVGDGTNTKRATNTYVQDPTIQLDGTYNVAYFGLVGESDIYGTDLTTIIKKTVNTYNFGLQYKSRRVLGLPLQIENWGHNDSTNQFERVSKVTYAYDEGNFGDSTLAQTIAPTQHDNLGYSSMVIAGRGNLTSTTRWDVRPGYESNSAYAVSSSVKYNTAGSPVSQTDPRGRVSTVSYTDTFNSTGNPTTYAYPTTITDAGNNSSSIKYRFDIGANVEATGPTPYGASYGKTTKRVFDSLGRLQRDSIYIGSAEYSYTRYDRPSPDNGEQLFTYSTLVDTGNPGPGPEDEVYSESLFDGAGRVRAARMDNPGSTGSYSGRLTEYDILGHVKRETLPTEIDSGWHPTGDDFHGTDVWLWNSKEYDWKGRSTRTIPSDSTGTDGKDTLISYAGCGCAGGQVTTIQGPITDAIDVSGTLQTTKRRTQKAYEDILGRTYKTEIWDLDGAGSAPYATTQNTYNGRDQVINVAEYAGATTGTHQDTATTYDGHGRVSTFHKPEEFDSSNNPTSTTTTYNTDDTLATVTDPRGAVTTYTYENVGGSLKRPLASKIEYAVPTGSGIHDPVDVLFAYDPIGNRTSMQDETGTLAYSYDALSRLASETKDFADSLTTSPNGSGVYTLSYTYNLNGSIKTITEPYGAVVKYSTDKTSRVTAVGDSSTDSKYVSSSAYRAFGGAKSMTMSTTSSTTMSLTYDGAMRPSTYTADNSTTGTGWVQNAGYTYNSDGAVKAITRDTAKSGFNQANQYDFAGRLKTNNMGSGSTFSQTLGYDAFNHLTDRTTSTYSLGQIGFTTAYTNNRNSVDTYDAAGHVIASSTSGQDLPGGGGWYADNKTWYYDAAGRMARFEESGPYGANTQRGSEMTFDGDGRPVKRAELQKDRFGGVWGNWNTFNWYYIYSSVTGQKITDLALDGSDAGHRVYMGGSVIWDNTYQGPYQNASPDAYVAIGFKVTDPVSGSSQEMNPGGDVPTQTANPNAENEKAGLGTSIPATDPGSVYQSNPFRGGYAGNAKSACTIDGFDWGDQACKGEIDHLQKSGELGAGGVVFGYEGTGVTKICDKNGKNCQDEDGLGIDVTVTEVGGLLGGGAGQHNWKPTDCEKRLAQAFSHSDDMIFSDVLDGDANDPVAYRGGGEIYPNGTGETHNHMYNPWSAPERATSVYAPAGGRIIDYGHDSSDQNFVSVFYERFGSARDVVLQIFHVNDFDGKGAVQSDGSVFLGHMGSNGNIGYRTTQNQFGGWNMVNGYHIHINATQKWWKKNYVKGKTQPFQALKDRRQVVLSSFCN